jgi:adenylyl-sulfate kinase
MHTIWQQPSPQPADGKVFWFTGLSSAGKTTLATAMCAILQKKNIFCVVLDGDELRSGINADLGFSIDDRRENIRRTAEIARLFAGNGITCIVSTISPYAELRENARKIIGRDRFFEIYINAPLQVCEKRDVKGLYRKARQNQIMSFTGIQDAYSPPENPDLEIRTDLLSIDESAHRLNRWYEDVINVPDKVFPSLK